MTHPLSDDAVEQLHGEGRIRPGSTLRLRLFAEHVPFDAIDDGVLGELGERDVELLVAVPPNTVGALPGLVTRAHRAGVRLGVWPLLHDVSGRYPSVDSLDVFRRHATRVLADVRRLSGERPTVVVDLEPPIWALRTRSTRGAAIGPILRWARWTADRAPEGRRRLAALVEALRDRGAGEVVATVVPVVLLGGWAERWTGAPVRGVGFDAVFPMAYTSLFEGYLPGVGRDLARRALRVATRAGGPAVALGLVGGGALGDERPYRGPAELAEDVRDARDAGATDIAVHGLDGMMAPGPIRPWLAALTR